MNYYYNYIDNIKQVSKLYHMDAQVNCPIIVVIKDWLSHGYAIENLDMTVR